MGFNSLAGLRSPIVNPYGGGFNVRNYRTG